MLYSPIWRRLAGQHEGACKSPEAVKCGVYGFSIAQPGGQLRSFYTAAATASLGMRAKYLLSEPITISKKWRHRRLL